MNLSKLFFIVFVFISASSTFAAKSPQDPMKCGMSRHWVRPHFRRAYVRSDGVRFKATHVIGHCSDNPDGYFHWRPLLKNGLPANWPIKSETGKSWTTHEIERVLEELARIPEALWSKNTQGIYRGSVSMDGPNPGATDRNGQTVIYDSAFDDRYQLGQVLAHEIAHQYFRDLPPKVKFDYGTSARWEVFDTVSGPFWVPRLSGYVKPNGANSLEEDYANNIEYFLYNPEQLKAIMPSAYDWISHHFGDNFKLGKGITHE